MLTILLLRHVNLQLVPELQGGSSTAADASRSSSAGSGPTRESSQALLRQLAEELRGWTRRSATSAELLELQKQEIEDMKNKLEGVRSQNDILMRRNQSLETQVRALKNKVHALEDDW